MNMVGRMASAAQRAKHWGGLVAEWQRSGVSTREFCERRGVKLGTFSWWRQELARRGHGRQPRVEMVEVGTPVVADRAVEVVLPNGIRLRVPVGFERRSLEELLGVVRAC
jgi:hypothetical protein